jgi:hypothetical protein
MLPCLSAWPSGRGRAPSCFTAHELDGSRVQFPGADTVNQAVHPSGVGKLVAVSVQWVTAVEGCEGKSVRRYDGWRTAYAAGGANYRTLVSCSPHGSVRHACVYIRTVNCVPLPLPLPLPHGHHQYCKPGHYEVNEWLYPWSGRGESETV